MELKPGFYMPFHSLNKLQLASIRQLLRIAPASHMIDITVRINGENRHFEADWIKSLYETQASDAGEPNAK